MAAILNLAILDSDILVFPFKLTHTCQVWFPPFAQKYFTHLFWLNLMMTAILNSAMLDSDTAILDSDPLLSSLRFTEKHSHTTLTLTQTNSFWLTCGWQPSWILPSWILPSYIQAFRTIKTWPFILIQLDDGRQLEFCLLWFSHFIHVGFSHCHLGFRHLVIFSQIHSKTLSLHSDSESN